MSDLVDTAFKKLASQRIQLLLETCDRALDAEACRADDAERRLESVRETLAAVRAQHEAIFNRYEELKSTIHGDSVPMFSRSAFAEPQVLKAEIFSAPVQRPHGESVVQRMRAQLEESARKQQLFGTPVAKRPKTKLGNLSKTFNF
jgi:hypothetical protein